MAISKEEFQFDLPEASSGFLLWKLTQKWQSGLKSLLRTFGLTHPQFVVLATASWYSTFASTLPNQKDLADRTGIDPMTTSVVVRGLLKKHWMERAEHPIDTRAYVVRVTPAGADLLRSAMRAVDDYDREFFLVLERGESVAFAASMKKLIAGTES